MSQKHKIRQEVHGETKQSAIQSDSRTPIHTDSPIGNHYQGDKQSFSQRATGNREAIRGSYEEDNVEDVIERIEDGKERSGNDSEVTQHDPDENAGGEDTGISTVRCLLAEEEGLACGFAPEMDAIRVVEMPDGEMRCVVEEDLGQMYFRAKNGYRMDDLHEAVRTKVYRAIAQWLNQERLTSLDELFKTLRRPSQKEFCSKYAINASDLSNSLKNAILEWPCCALPLKELFNNGKKD